MKTTKKAKKNFAAKNYMWNHFDNEGFMSHVIVSC